MADAAEPAEPAAWDEPDLGTVPGRPPDHVPQLHRAMSEAADDLEAVEDRLSTLFERTDGTGPDSSRRTASPTGRPGDETGTVPDAGTADDDDEDDIFDFFEDGAVAVTDLDVDVEEPVVADRMAIIGEYEDDIGGEFADLDAELAAESPDEPAGKGKRRMFRRRAKGATAARG
jgi:hypothetical protein